LINQLAKYATLRISASWLTNFDFSHKYWLTNYRISHN